MSCLVPSRKPPATISFSVSQLRMSTLEWSGGLGCGWGEGVRPGKENYGCAFVSLFDGMTPTFGRVWLR
jgi:hypothetical protein